MDSECVLSKPYFQECMGVIKGVTSCNLAMSLTVASRLGVSWKYACHMPCFAQRYSHFHLSVIPKFTTTPLNSSLSFTGMDNSLHVNEYQTKIYPRYIPWKSSLQKAENTTSPHAVKQSYLCMLPRGTAALGDRWHASPPRRRRCSWQFF